MDKITIKGLRLFAYHGVNPEEKEQGQTFIIDLDYYLDTKKACGSDCVNDTVSYAKVAKTIRRVFTEKSYDLIEAAAQAVCGAVLSEYPAVVKTEITLKKPEAPVNADFDYMAVTLVRER